ncbi:MAG: hypothetical protein RIT45_14 [Pseudomonadota bacterium]
MRNFLRVLVAASLSLSACGEDSQVSGPQVQADANGGDGQGVGDGQTPADGTLDGGGCVPADCAGSKPCHVGTCVGGDCTYAAVPDDTPCDDDDACTVDDRCQDAACLPGAATACDDDNPCTVDGCKDAAGGCTHTPSLLACDDGNACTVGDQCQAGACAAGLGRDCDDDNVCTVDSCNPAAAPESACQHVAVGGLCSDGDPCTVQDGCVDGACAGKPMPCDDDNPCTDDVCEAKGDQGACVHTANSGACSDGDVCTLGDACKDGACAAGAAAVCNDGNPCTTDACDAKLGCTATDNKAACDDGNACTLGDGCAGGSCVGAGVLDCEDGNGCTLDACLTASGCSHTPSTAECSDGDACSLGDQCVQGACVAGKAVVCDDGNPCTADACSDGVCLATAVTGDCDDGNVCTVQDGCDGGSCTPGGALVCNDGNPCTDDACDPKATSAESACKAVANAASCDDGNLCTQVDQCTGGACVGSGAVVCDDGNPCTDDACAHEQGGCVALANAATCTDGNVCTAGDACLGGVCKPGKFVACDDGNPCTDDACDASKGCGSAPNALPCSDGSVCTVGDVCSGGACKPGAAMVCDDGNACTTDACDAKTGCVQTFNQAPCNDGNVCSKDDACKQGVCAGAPVVCDDGNACTADFCDANKGCASVKIQSDCDDGSQCTTGDVCTNGFCIGKPITCVDGDVCTEDGCDPKKGCDFGPLTGTACGAGTCDKGDCLIGDKAHPATSCKEILTLAPKSASGAYWLDPDGTGGSKPAYQAWCDMVTDGGGWTLLLKVDGNSAVFNQTAAAWGTATPINPSSFDLSQAEARLGSYGSVAFTELRVGMALPNQAANFIQFALAGPSLHQLVSSGGLTKSSAGRKAWKSLLPDSSLQLNCSEEGVNSVSCRLGISGNQEADCKSPDSWIGIGCGTYAAGNYANGQWSPDNGGKALRAFAWVLAR